MPSEKEKNCILLEKYTPIAKRLISEAQELADSLNHQLITTVHLTITIACSMEQELLLNQNQKIGCKELSPLFPADLVVKFLEFYNSTFQTAYRKEVMRTMPLVNRRGDAYLDTQLLSVMTFAEDREKVTSIRLINELMLYMKNEAREARDRRSRRK